MSDARQIIDAMDPKRIFREVVRGGRLRSALMRDRWEPFGSSSLAWQKTLTTSFGKRTYFVWWDAKAGEWVIKKEGQKQFWGRWCGWHDLGFSTWNTEDEVINRLVAVGALYRFTS